MKKLWLLLFVSALSIGSVIAKAGEMDDASAVVNVVSSFYGKYIRGDSGHEWRDWPEVDALLGQNVDKLHEDAAKTEYGSLEYDPILMAQDIPVGLEYAKPVINGVSAELVVYGLWRGGAPKYPFCVRLTKKEKNWRITEIVNMEFPDKKKKCGGMRVMPK